MDKYEKLLPSPRFGTYLLWKTKTILKQKRASYLVAVPILSLFLLNSPAANLGLVKDKVNSFVLARAQNPQSQTVGEKGSADWFVTQENSLLPANQILSQEEVVNTRFNVLVTAYSSEEWQTDNTPFVTASGTYVRDGVIASNLLPFGTKARIPEIFGQKVFAVEDRLHSRKGLYQIDVWFPSTQEALAFGAKYTYLEVVE